MRDSDISKFTRNPDLHLLVGRTFLNLAGSHEFQTEEVYADAAMMVDVLTFVTALVVESDPGAATNQGLRLRAEDIARRVNAYARAIREEGDATGEPVIMQFGGLRSIVKPDVDQGALRLN